MPNTLILTLAGATLLGMSVTGPGHSGVDVEMRYKTISSCICNPIFAIGADKIEYSQQCGSKKIREYGRRFGVGAIDYRQRVCDQVSPLAGCWIPVELA